MASKTTSTSKPQTRASRARSESAGQPNPTIRKSTNNPGAAPANLDVTWSQRHTDFVIILKSGQELGVHKVISENSPVFDAMLEQDMKEALNNQVKIHQFNETTVVSFLEYIYFQCGKQMFKSEDFEQNKFTVDLMSMAHYYQVQSLLTDCAEYLKAHINDSNVMDVWMEAEKCESKTLCAAALEHLVERPNGKLLQEVPGFQDAFQANDKPLKDLVSKLMDKVSHLKAETSRLKDFEGIIKIRLKVPNSNRKDKHYYVNMNDTVCSFVRQVKGRFSNVEEKSFVLTKTESPNVARLQKKCSLWENGIRQNTTLYLWDFDL